MHAMAMPYAKGAIGIWAVRELSPVSTRLLAYRIDLHTMRTKKARERKLAKALKTFLTPRGNSVTINSTSM